MKGLWKVVVIAAVAFLLIVVSTLFFFAGFGDKKSYKDDNASMKKDEETVAISEGRIWHLANWMAYGRKELKARSEASIAASYSKGPMVEVTTYKDFEIRDSQGKKENEAELHIRALIQTDFAGLTQSKIKEAKELEADGMKDTNLGKTWKIAKAIMAKNNGNAKDWQYWIMRARLPVYQCYTYGDYKVDNNDGLGEINPCAFIKKTLGADYIPVEKQAMVWHEDIVIEHVWECNPPPPPPPTEGAVAAALDGGYAPKIKTADGKTAKGTFTLASHHQTEKNVGGLNCEYGNHEIATNKLIYPMYNDLIRDIVYGFEPYALMGGNGTADGPDQFLPTVRDYLKMFYMNDVGVDLTQIVPMGSMFIAPMEPGTYAITSSVGNRTLDGKTAFHQGIDLSAPVGTPIYAAGSGAVVYAGPVAGYGNLILINHKNGFFTAYGHMRTEDILVAAGQAVSQGEPIAAVGSEGESTGSHLHFEVCMNQIADMICAKDEANFIDTQKPDSKAYIPYPTSGADASKQAAAQALFQKFKAMAPQERAKQRMPGFEAFALGWLASQYESKIDACHTTIGDSGGQSCGYWQIAHAPGTLYAFVDTSAYSLRVLYPDLYDKLKPFGLGTMDFQNKWAEVAAADPVRFKEAQYTFIYETHYKLGSAAMLEKGINIETMSMALKETVFSTMVQHGSGGGASILRSSVGNDPASMNDEKLITAIFQERSNRICGGGASANSADVVAGVCARYQSEMQDALALLKNNASTLNK